MMPLPNSLPVPGASRRRDAVAEFARYELRDGGAWLLSPIRASPSQERSGLKAPSRPAGRIAKVARTVASFLF